MSTHAIAYLANLTNQVRKTIALEIPESKASSIAASAFAFHFTDKESLKFQNYYVETVQNRKGFLDADGFFLKFKKMYALQGIDKAYLDNLESQKKGILDALEADELTSIYVKYFAQVSIQHGAGQRLKNLGSFFAKLAHTFHPSDYCALDNPIKKHFGLGNEGFYISFIVISDAYKLWLKENPRGQRALGSPTGECCGRPVQRHKKAKWRRSDLHHLFAGNQAGNGFFYSVNPTVKRAAKRLAPFVVRLLPR